jgi:poly-gamma-glutamate capsule biosynthesis protein CapA/YwtB (metallophosphatase superfamily)
MPEPRRSSRRDRRRAGPTLVQRRRRAAIAAIAGLALIAGLTIGSCGGPTTLTREQQLQAQRASAPVHFTVSVSGDLLIHSPLWERALALGGGNKYDFAPELNQLKPYVAAADLGICHVETPMTPAPPTSYPIFNTPPALADGIKATGWDVCDTASNHSFDQGQTGIDDTGKALDHAGVAHTGSFPSAAAQRKLVVRDVNGVKVAFLAFTTDTNGIPAPHPWSVNIASPGRILDDAKRARKAGAEAVIVNVHWGGEIVPEYQVEPSSGQLALARKLTASPLITAVVGQGPHAVQPIERINKKFVVFSEGNLISNQSPDYGLPASSQDGMVVLLHCVADGSSVRVEKVRYVPVYVSHPDYEVLPIGDALRKGEGDATALRDSYKRTVSVAGKGRGVEPVPPSLPGT